MGRGSRRSPGGLLVAIVLLAAVPAPLAAQIAMVAQAGPDLDATSKALVQRLVLERAVSLAVAGRRADEREQTLLAALAGKDKKLRKQARQTKHVLAQLDAVTAERERLIREIADRDASFRAELDAYRRAIAEMAASPSPERRTALQRYADGDRAGAFAVLEELSRVETEARRKAAEHAANLESAKQYRELGRLAEDMKDRGEKTTAEVLAIWQLAAGLDPDDFWTSVYVARLAAEAGQSELAISAARWAVTIARDDRERSVALSELGGSQLTMGDLRGANGSLQDSLEIDRRLAAADPKSTSAQRDLSVSMSKLGAVQLAQGKLDDAHRSFQESFEIRQKVALATPASDQAQYDLCTSLDRLGDLQVAQGNLDDAFKTFQRAFEVRSRLAAAGQPSADAQRSLSLSLDRLSNVQIEQGKLDDALRSLQDALTIDRKLAASNCTSARAQRDVSVDLNKLGSVQARQGKLDDALATLQEALTIRRKLAKANDKSAEPQRDLSVSLERIGDVQIAQGRLDDALQTFQEALEIDRKLAAAEPTSADAQRDLSVSLWKMAKLPNTNVRWAEVAQVLRSMKERGMLRVRDLGVLDEAERRSAAEARAP